jgi:serine/threonine-protein kinase
MPDVTDASFDTAESQLTNLGLTVVRRVQSSDTVPDGSVISTSPEAGVNLGAGEIVTVIESSGKQLIAVPSINLMTMEKAMGNFVVSVDIFNHIVNLPRQLMESLL